MARPHAARIDRDVLGVGDGDRTGRGPVGFSSAAGLQASLERRGSDRRERARAVTSLELGTRELCHDLRQPLATATVLTARISQDPGLSEASRAQVELVQHALGCLSRLITDHLSPPLPVVVDLASLAADVCAALELVTPRGVELVVDHASQVTGDPVLLARMLGNLVENARSVVGREGRVRVTVGETPDGAHLDVEDSGPTTDTGSSAGHGLGLMIAQTVAARHSGHVECGPSALGGLRLRVVLPGGPPPVEGEQR